MLVTSPLDPARNTYAKKKNSRYRMVRRVFPFLSKGGKISPTRSARAGSHNTGVSKDQFRNSDNIVECRKVNEAVICLDSVCEISVKRW